MASAPRDEDIQNMTGVNPMQARAAFEDKDSDASKRLHEAHAGGHNEDGEHWHGGAGSDYIKSMVFGGLDGIITTFAIVAAVAGAGLKVEVVILMGVANLIADAISMGVGDFLSSKAEMDFILKEREREAWETDTFVEGEKREMVDIYVKKKGFSREDAQAVIDTYTKVGPDGKLLYRDAFVDHMMVEELGFMVPDPDDNPAWDGLVTFLSFVAFGSIPVIFYIVFYAAGYDEPAVQFAIACVATALTMFTLGVAKARITKQSIWESGGLMTLNGGIAAAAAYFIGWGLEQALGVKAAA